METKEESQRAAMDFVERLRLQYAQQDEKPAAGTSSRGGPGDTPTRGSMVSAEL